MRFFLYFLLILLNFSCFGMGKKPSSESRSLFSETDSWISKNLSPDALSIFPDKRLKQIIIIGEYYPEDPERVKEIERDYRKEGLLKDGEILREKYPWTIDREKESFHYTYKKYCYNTVKIEDRSNCYYNDNLRVRIYDKEGKMIAEDCLRLGSPERYDENGKYSKEYLKRLNTSSFGIPRTQLVTAEEGILESRSIIVYIPYDQSSYATRIVRLEGEKEIILESFGGGSSIKKSKLIELYYTHHISIYRGFGHDYDAESQCHTSLRPR